jgi:hypothetical protein
MQRVTDTRQIYSASYRSRDCLLTRNHDVILKKHSALEEQGRRVPQHIRYIAYDLYSYLFLLIFQITALKDFLCPIILSIFYIFISVILWGILWRSDVWILPNVQREKNLYNQILLCDSTKLKYSGKTLESFTTFVELFVYKRLRVEILFWFCPPFRSFL